MSASVWDDVVGQTTAIDQLRAAAAHGPVHAYLFTGPPGSTKHEAARAFAAMLLTGSDDPTTRDARLILAGEHPDVREIERVGASINVEQARDIVKLSSRSPIESDHKVLILHEFHFLDEIPLSLPGDVHETLAFLQPGAGVPDAVVGVHSTEEAACRNRMRR